MFFIYMGFNCILTMAWFYYFPSRILTQTMHMPWLLSLRLCFFRWSSSSLSLSLSLHTQDDQPINCSHLGGSVLVWTLPAILEASSLVSTLLSLILSIALNSGQPPIYGLFCSRHKTVLLLLFCQSCFCHSLNYSALHRIGWRLL